jgi:aryl-alcohol dehydrogenase-like predicted oxidoreductase
VTTVSLREPQIMIRTGYGRLFSLSRDHEQQCCQRQAASDVLLTDRTRPRRASTATDMANAGRVRSGVSPGAIAVPASDRQRCGRTLGRPTQDRRTVPDRAPPTSRISQHQDAARLGRNPPSSWTVLGVSHTYADPWEGMAPGTTGGNPSNYGRGMEHRSLGRTGMQVSPLCLGAMMFGAWGEPDHDTSIKIIHRALDAGINFIDTADVYSQGESEVIVGKALANGRRDEVILATKFHFPMDVAMGQSGGDPNKRGNSRRWIVQEVENSLRRLDTDWIDLYQVHRPDPDTAVEETLSALTDLQRQGKIRAFGSSTFPAHETVEAQWTARDRGLGRFVTEQPPYSILVRGIEADLLPVAQRYGMGVLPWSPLAGGWLTGRYRKGRPAPTSHRAERMPARYDLSDPDNLRKLEAAEALAVLADNAGLSLIHLALAFVLAHPAVTAPIIGPRTMDQLESQLGAVEVTLSTDVLDQIDDIVPPGVTLARADNGYLPQALQDPFLRRRRTS